MRAWVLHGINDLKLEDIAIPQLGEKEVLVKIEAAGICGSDIPRIYKTGAHAHPLVVGHEFSGVVVKVGENANKDWENKPVGVFPLIPCGKCIPCQNKQYEMCRNYSYLGSRSNGGFAEYVAVPEWNLIQLPEQVTYEVAAMLEPMAVAVHAMRRGLIENNYIVIYGLGTIGLLMLMFLQEEKKCNREKIGNILVIGNKEFQRKKVLELGLEEKNYCDSKIENVEEWVLDRTAGIGADVFFECIGKNETFEQAVDLTAPSGKICLVGNPYSDMKLSKNVYWKILRNQLSITGTWNSSFRHDAGDDWNYVLEKLRDNRIKPEKLISHRFGIDDIDKGLKIMRDKSEDYVKIIFTSPVVVR
jgi:L-iditol 2-dehydrogenase